VDFGFIKLGMMGLQSLVMNPCMATPMAAEMTQ
jgi:hypothetical protein